MPTTATTGRSAVMLCDLIVAQGADNEYVFEYGEYLNDEWMPYDLSAWTARSQMRERVADGPLWYTATTVDGTLVLGQDGAVTLKIPHIATQATAWDTRSRGVWDVELTDPSGHVVRLVEGAVLVSHDVTRAV